jgi:hypothetical protein
MTSITEGNEECSGSLSADEISRDDKVCPGKGEL